MTVDHAFGTPTVPSTLRRVRETSTGARLHLDTEGHDLGLLRSLAEAVRSDEETAVLLSRYAEVLNHLDEVPEHDWRSRRSLEDKAREIREEIDAKTEWQPIGEGMTASLDRPGSAELAAVMVRVVANQIEAEEGVVRDLRLVQTGGAA